MMQIDSQLKMPDKIAYKTLSFNIRRDILVCLFLVISLLAVYSQVRNFDFINYDDDDYVYNNPHVKAGLTLENIAWTFTATHAANWHPLTWLSHMSDVHLYGLDPGMHHLTNVFFHIANSLLLFTAFRKMTGDSWRSALASALFALHPLHVESVAWISERKDVLSTFFWMMTMLAYIRYAEQPGIRRYVPVLIFFAFGLMAKPMLVTLPFVLLLLDYWPLRRLTIDCRLTIDDCRLSIEKISSQSIDNRQSTIINRQSTIDNHQSSIVNRQSSIINRQSSVILEKIPLIILSAVSCIATLIAQQSGGAVRTLDSYPLTFRLANAVVSYTGYIEKMIWPHDLSIFYPPRVVPWWHVTGACLVLVSISALVIRFAKKRPCLAVGWLWYIGTLIPVIGVIQVGSQAMADRYTYISLIGLFIIIAWGFKFQVSSFKFQILCTIFLSILAVSSWIQLRYWANSIALFEHALDATSNNILAHTNLGLALAKEGRREESVNHYHMALQLSPDNAKVHNNMGVALFRLGKIRESVIHFQKALQKKPDFADAYNNLKKVLKIQKEKDEALAKIKDALKNNPDDAKLYNELGNLYKKYRNTDKATEQYKKALAIQPEFPESLKNLAIAYAVKGEYENAVSLLKKITDIQPENSDAPYLLACIYARQNRKSESVDWLKKAVKRGYNNLEKLKTDNNLENIRNTSYYKELIKGRFH
ncbi:MAG: tetratricopeptide repeat protein [Desulfobacterales bacterium]|nr:tetratricopeptide repeat protein [Desulfobacterales bacterium]